MYKKVFIAGKAVFIGSHLRNEQFVYGNKITMPINTQISGNIKSLPSDVSSNTELITVNTRNLHNIVKVLKKVNSLIAKINAGSLEDMLVTTKKNCTKNLININFYS